MQFLALTRRRTDSFPEAEFTSRVPAEVGRARTLYAEGFIRQVWHRTDLPGACLLIEAESEAGVREKLDTLPFAEAGMLDITIVPLKPYAGFCP
jgi:hypothetical protein